MDVRLLKDRNQNSADLKVSEQCGIAARKWNWLLGMIKRNITYYILKIPQ